MSHQPGNAGVSNAAADQRAQENAVVSSKLFSIMIALIIWVPPDKILEHSQEVLWFDGFWGIVCMFYLRIQLLAGLSYKSGQDRDISRDQTWSVVPFLLPISMVFAKAVVYHYEYGVDLTDPYAWLPYEQILPVVTAMFAARIDMVDINAVGLRGIQHTISGWFGQGEHH